MAVNGLIVLGLVNCPAIVAVLQKKCNRYSFSLEVLNNIKTNKFSRFKNNQATKKQYKLKRAYDNGEKIQDFKISIKSLNQKLQ